MVEFKELMTAMEENLRQKEAELASIRATEEKEDTENALRVQELQARVQDLEGAIDEAHKSLGSMEADSTEKASDLTDLKSALEACQQELAKHVIRADGAEVSQIEYHRRQQVHLRSFKLYRPERTALVPQALKMRELTPLWRRPR